MQIKITGPTTIKRKKDQKVFTLTGEATYDPDIYDVVSGPSPAPPTPPTPDGVTTDQEVTKQGVYTVTKDASGKTTKTFLRPLQLGDVFQGTERYSEAGWTPLSSEELAGKGTPAVTEMFTDYVVQQGDTLSALAAKNNTTVAAIQAANPQITDPNLIYAGATLKIPKAAVPGVPGVPGDGEVPTLPSADEVIELSDEEKLKIATDLATKGVDPKTIMEWWRTISVPPDKAAIEKEVYDAYGISDLETKFLTRPTQTFEDIYQAAYTTLELGDLKAEIDELRAKIDKADADYAEGTENINENPWISEAGRVGKIRRLTDEYNKTAGRLNNQMTLATNLYDRGKAEAENIATRALNTFAREREWAKEELQYYISRAESEVSARIALEEEKEERLLARYFPEILAAVPPEVKEGKKPETIKKDILGRVNSAIDEYRLSAPEFMYREKFIDLMVDTYGEKWRDYITKTVYTRMPDKPKSAGGGTAGGQAANEFYSDL